MYIGDRMRRISVAIVAVSVLILACVLSVLWLLRKCELGELVLN
jgi:hypothetical protein